LKRGEASRRKRPAERKAIEVSDRIIEQEKKGWRGKTIGHLVQNERGPWRS